MSHEMMGAERRLVYTMPALPSDAVRCREFDRFFEAYRGPSFSVRTQDGWCWISSHRGNPAFTVTFSSRAALDAVIEDSTEDAVAKAFLDGNLDIQGELFPLLSVAEYVLRHSSGLSRGLIGAISRATLDWVKGRRRPPVVTGWRFRGCSSDLPVEFFQGWLGPSLAHFCARFRRPEDTLEAAQRNALEKICAILQLEEGDHLLDLSCGWGSLLLHAAAQHGVRGQGITFSDQQAAIVRERCQRHGLGGQCTADCTDLAKVSRPGVSFEKIVDIGLFHQVAHSCFRSYLGCTFQTLALGGLLLLHRLTRSPKAPRNATEFGHIEPSATNTLPLLSSELQMAEAAGFQILSVEDLSREYRNTLHHWIERLRRTGSGTDMRQFRAWLFHLLDTATKLDAGDVQLDQVLLSKPAGGWSQATPEC